MQNVININGMRLYAYHGCLEEEARIGGNYLVDVRLIVDFSEAAKTDDLHKTIDYCSVYEICKSEMKVRSKLIEAVGHRIHSRIRTEFQQASLVTVKVTKLIPPMNGDVESVSIEITG